MISTTLDGVPCYLWPFSPEWSQNFVLTLEIDSTNVRANSGIEARRTTGKTLRLSGKFLVRLDDADARSLRKSLLAMTSEPLLMPLWPFDDLVSQTRIPDAFDDCLCVTYEPGWSAYAFHNLSSPPGGFTAAARRAPLSVGYFTKLLVPEPYTDESYDSPVEWDEAGTYPLTVKAQTFTAGPATATGAKPIFPVGPDWTTTPNIGGTDFVIERQKIGTTRKIQPAFYPQTPARTTSYSFWFDGFAQWSAHAGLFAQSGGDVGTFWLPNQLTETPLTSTAAAAATTVTVDEPTMLDQGARVFALIKIDGTMDVRTITNGGPLTNPLHFSGGLSQSYDRGTTIVSSMVLSRFRAPKITFTFETDSFGTVQASFIEIPTEYVAQSNETEGVTSGALPELALLFKLTATEGAVTTVVGLADYDRDIWFDGVLYAQAQIEMAKVLRTINADNDNASISFHIPSGDTFFSRLFPYEIEGTVDLVVYEVTLSTSTSRDFGTDFGTEFA